MRQNTALPIALAALLLTGACAYGGVTGYAPTGYPAGYDSGMGSGLVQQPGDLFGGQNVVSVAVFDAPLAPYGEWINSRFGRAFRPDVPQDWRPYVNGQWGEDRVWISNDPWGWATDHYGRWGFDEQVGWVWVPGTEWAPSWVAFRDDPAQNVSGWAPIPPNVSYSVNLGFGSGFGFDNFNNWYAPSWVWVPRSYVYQPGFGGRVLPWRYGANYWGGSRWQYQPGRGARPGLGYAPGYRSPGGNWQGQPDQFGQRRQPRDAYQGRPPGDGRFSNRLPQDGYYGMRQPRGGDWSRAPQGDRVSDGIAEGIINNQPRPDRRGGGGYRGMQGMPGARQPMAMPGGVGAPQRQAPVVAVERARPMPPPPMVERPVERPVPVARVQRNEPDGDVRPQ